MALTAIIQFGNNTVKRYFKEYLVTDCHIVHRRNYNKFCPEGNGACERLEVSVVCPGRDDLDCTDGTTCRLPRRGVSSSAR